MRKLLMTTAACVLMMSAAHGQTAPTPVKATAQDVAFHSIDMTTLLHDVDGRPIKDPSQATKDDPGCAKCGDLTVGHLIGQALLANYPDEANLAGDVKWARGALAMRIRDEKAAVLTTEETATVKTLVGKYASPLALVQIYPLLNPNDKPPTVH